ncbi:P-loop containing nucleoside triphosphate hydrolase protein [Calocera cornea HHB12733]|uniref:p-loop containing nucleoside triphosphate hydrolase protein n=1 Tax=Calocera cornea HHB12733 TaxID=1353952 RepID=A0A165IJ53_9BASI|nr:P-loop containing nucleoside triphosphate hydrolase protein [Calocera cornea HHB12733]
MPRMSSLDALEVVLGRVLASAISDTDACSANSIWHDLRLLPAYASAVSLLLLIWTTTSNRYSVPTPSTEVLERQSVRDRITSFVKAREGWVIYAFNITRVLGAVALVGLTLASVLLSGQGRDEETNEASQIPIGGGQPWGWNWDCTESGLLVGYVYATILSVLAIVLTGPSRTACSLHAACLLFIQFLVFAWRNLLPLTTYINTPADGALPWLIWTRCAFVTLVGLVLPVLVPQVYVPYDPENPAAESAPDQTASILGFLFFSFLSPMVFRAWRLPSLPYDKLPPLPDTDWSVNLRKRAMDKLDPLRRRELGKKDRHLFFGMMDIFWWDFLCMGFFLIGQVSAGFLSPIGINRLLTYIEDRGEGATIRPSVWISFIFLQPMLNCFALNLYNYTSMRMTVQADSILTQLIFDHALRIRLTDEIESSASTSGTSTPTSLGEITDDAVSSANVETEITTLLGPEPPTTEAESAPSSSSTVAVYASASKTELPKNAETIDGGNSASKAMHLSARINGLFGTDIATCINGRDFLVVFLNCPFEAMLSMWFLWAILSWAAVAGMLFLVITLPIPGMVPNLMQSTQAKLMEKKDARVQKVTESVGIIRMIKMFAWEPLVESELVARRADELRYLRLKNILAIVNMEISGVLPVIAMIIAFAFYTLIQKKELDAARVFSSVPVFSMLRGDMITIVSLLTTILESKVSLDRITYFLHSSHLLDRYNQMASEPFARSDLPVDDDIVGFHNATFTWADATIRTPQAGQRDFRLHIDSLIFRKEEVNIIVGPTGCGKTSMLMALLGEMHYEAQSVDSWFNLPRGGGIAYVAQESWVQNDTIKANILFGAAYDEVRYKKGMYSRTIHSDLLYQCALEPDLAMFTAGDETEVGERGLTLSGGQKARVTLARALYSQAKILLLDDIVSALDVHTARWIVKKCLQGDLIEARTVILVTHAVALIAPIAKNIVSLSPHGRILSQGSLNKSLTLDQTLRRQVEESKEEFEDSSTDSADDQMLLADTKTAGTLIAEEEIADGRVKWATSKLFLDSYGGLPFWILLLLGYSVAIGSEVLSTWWLGYWAQAYVDATNAVNVPYYLSCYIAIIVLQESAWFIMQFFYVTGSIRACRIIHDTLCQSILRSTLRWMDSTPVGRIIARFTQDMSEFDGGLTNLVEILVRETVSLVLRLGVILLISPIWGIPSAAIIAVGLLVGQVYIHAQMCIRRLRSNWRSPLFNHLGAAVSGLISIRAYGAEEAFKQELRQRADAYARPSRVFYNLGKWMGTRSDLLRATFVAGLATYLVYARQSIGASTTGFSLANAMEFSYSILMWVRFANNVELASNSLERMRDYLVIDHEPPPVEGGKPPAYWPASGAIRVENLFARYSKDEPLVLKDITFEIKSGERVGIVGRTGSGKSSLALSLLRLIPTEGTVIFDGQPTSDMNLDALRTNLAIIPQEPTLMSGTLRSNLDPFSQHDDGALYHALRATGLITETGASDGTNLTLDSTVLTAGSNFSVGQRQLIALARAILRNTRALILDEATASVDSETDALIQASIRKDLQHATLITIAHRLLTIMDYDRIMVLDGGKLVEFDTPWTLLQNEKGYFRSLVDDSGDRDRLFAVAEKAFGQPEFLTCHL